MTVVLISLDFQKISDIYFNMKKIVIFSICLFSLPLPSYALESGEMQRAAPDLRANERKDIAHYLKNSLTEVVTLTALETEFDLYYYAADEKEPIGSLLFFPDERSHADWPINLQPLRTGLTRYKWQTAVVTLPVATHSPLPKRSVYRSDLPEQTTNAETDSDTDTSKADPDVQQKEAQQEHTMADMIGARATAAVAMLKEKSDMLIITGIGQGATWATALALTVAAADQQNTRLLLINPQQSEDISAPTLSEMISQLTVDTFDIYTPVRKNASYAGDHALARKRAANQSEVENYLQIKAPQRAWQQNGNDWLFRKVRGLLKNNVENILDDKAEKKMQPKAPEKINQPPGTT